MYDLKKYKQFARIQLKDRWKVPVLMMLIIFGVFKIFAIPDYISFFTTHTMPKSIEDIKNLIVMEFNIFFALPASTETTVTDKLFFLLSIIENCVALIFLFASINVFISMSRSPEPITFSLFIEGLSNWNQAITGGLWQLLWIFLWALLSIPISSIILIILFLFGISKAAFSTQLIVTFIVCLIGMIPAFIKMLSYSQMFYLLAEYPKLPVRKALAISCKITNNYKLDIFLTILSFAGWFILDRLTFGIAGLWFIPYYRMTRVNVFHALMKNALEKGIITPEELN
ncbi:MAG: DUF975 family protein [Treponema sp.]|nr:DUF975 family protein [Treponema sp.]